MNEVDEKMKKNRKLLKKKKKYESALVSFTDLRLYSLLEICHQSCHRPRLCPSHKVNALCDGVE